MEKDWARFGLNPYSNLNFNAIIQKKGDASYA